MKRGFWVFAAAFGGVIGSLVACSGADQTDLFGPSTASDVTENAPTDPAATPEPVSASSSGDPGKSSSSSSSSSSSGGPKDAGVDATKPVPAVVSCGKNNGVATTCSLPSQLCCAREDLFGGDIELTCESSAPGACDAIPISCDEKADCPSGSVCCGTYDNDGYREISCQTSCTSGATIKAARFCNPKAAPSECGTGQTCGASQSLPGFFVCK